MKKAALLGIIVGLLFVPIAGATISKIYGVSIEDVGKIQGVALSSFTRINNQEFNTTPPVIEAGLTVDGNQFKYNGSVTNLVGAVWMSHWNIGSSGPNTYDLNESIFSWVSDEGANLISIPVNLVLWNESAVYRSNIHTYTEWANDYGLFYTLKLQRADGSQGDGYYDFSGPGDNYKIILNSTMREKARLMFMGWAEAYGGDDNFAGIQLLNEPDAQYVNYDRWDEHVEYYEDMIDNVTTVDPDCIFYVQEPWDYGTDNSHWDDPANPHRGYLNRTNVVYEYHIYYNFKIGYLDWADQFNAGNLAAGNASILQWHNEKVLGPYNSSKPVFCGEYGTYATNESYAAYGSPTPKPYYQHAVNAQQETMKALDINYVQFYLRSMKSGNVDFCLMKNVGDDVGEEGYRWARHIQDDLIQPHTSDPGTLYFYADFEEMDLTDITEGGGMTQTQGVGSTVSLANIGYGASDYAANHSIPTGQPSYARAETIRWRYDDGVQSLYDLTEWYQGCAFYLSDPFTVSGGTWSLIVQSHASTLADSDFQYALIVAENGSLGVGCKIGESLPYGPIIWYDNDAVSLETWHTVVFYCNSTLNGELKVWIDNTVEGSPDFQISDDFRVMKDGAWFTDEPGTIPHSGMYFGQSEANAAHKYVITDEFRIASSFNLAVPQQ